MVKNWCQFKWSLHRLQSRHVCTKDLVNCAKLELWQNRLNLAKAAHFCLLYPWMVFEYSFQLGCLRINLPIAVVHLLVPSKSYLHHQLLKNNICQSLMLLEMPKFPVFYLLKNNWCKRRWSCLCSNRCLLDPLKTWWLFWPAINRHTLGRKTACEKPVLFSSLRFGLSWRPDLLSRDCHWIPWGIAGLNLAKFLQTWDSCNTSNTPVSCQKPTPTHRRSQMRRPRGTHTYCEQ